MTPLEKELVEALDRYFEARGSGVGAELLAEQRLRTLLARAKSNTRECVVADDGHGRAMVGGRRLAFGGAGIMVNDAHWLRAEGRTVCDGPIRVGTRVRVELRDGCDFATLIEVLP